MKEPPFASATRSVRASIVAVAGEAPATPTWIARAVSGTERPRLKLSSMIDAVFSCIVAVKFAAACCASGSSRLGEKTWNVSGSKLIASPAIRVESVSSIAAAACSRFSRARSRSSGSSAGSSGGTHSPAATRPPRSDAARIARSCSTNASATDRPAFRSALA